MSDSTGLLRPKLGHDSGKVAFVELFFDLVFVFAITQLSHGLIGHFSALGALQTLMLLLAVWWVWVFTTWVTNWLDPEKIPVRLCLLVLMGLGLVMSAALPGAFGERGLVFAGCYVLMQVGRTLFFLHAVRGHPGMVRNFQRILVWLSAGAVLWIAGGFAEGNGRMGWWGAALLVEYLSPSLGFRVPGLGKSTAKDWDVSGHHMAERCGLFIIIALGESILVSGATFSGQAWTPEGIAAFAATVIGSIAMWWLYFDTASDYGTRTIAASENPGHLARLAYTYLHLFLVAGIILSAAGDEFVLAHPHHASPPVTIALLGGAGLYLLGSLLFKRAISGGVPYSHLTAILGLGGLALASERLAPWLLAALTTTVLAAVAAWERQTKCLADR